MGSSCLYLSKLRIDCHGSLYIQLCGFLQNDTQSFVENELPYVEQLPISKAWVLLLC